MKAFLLLVLLTLPACAGLGQNFNSMTADQIAAATKDKSASASCIQFTGTGGQFSALHMNNDKGSIQSGSASLKCGSAEATFSDAGKSK
jgi:hypothetical protein